MKLLACLFLCISCEQDIIDYCDEEIEKIDKRMELISGNDSLDIYDYYYGLGMKRSLIDLKQTLNSLD